MTRGLIPLLSVILPFLLLDPAWSKDEMADAAKASMSVKKGEMRTSKAFPLPLLTEKERDCLNRRIGKKALDGMAAKTFVPTPEEDTALEMCVNGYLRMTSNTKRPLSHLLPHIGPPTDPLKPAAENCSPTVYMWLEPEQDGDVYFSDEEFEAHYAVDCATAVTVFDNVHRTARARLDWFLNSPDAVTTAGSPGVHYPDAAEAGALSGEQSFPRSSDTQTPIGHYAWVIYAFNDLNPSAGSVSETLSWNVIKRPATSESCAAWNECVDTLVRHVASVVPSGITNNDSLDTTVAAFSDRIYNRYEIGLRLETDLEDMESTTTIRCTENDVSYFSLAEPDTVYLNWIDSNDDGVMDQYPTDYALLHELTHKIGFNERLIEAYMDAGIWERAEIGTDEYRQYAQQVETMTIDVSGAPFNRARHCLEY